MMMIMMIHTPTHVLVCAHPQELGIADSVDWCVNLSFEDLRTLLGESVGGLHTMLDEHFGISVVEYMAAGVIPIAHNSGGAWLVLVMLGQVVTHGAPAWL